jgi:hypothetical protein
MEGANKDKEKMEKIPSSIMRIVLLSAPEIKYRSDMIASNMETERMTATMILPVEFKCGKKI